MERNFLDQQLNSDDDDESYIPEEGKYKL